MKTITITFKPDGSSKIEASGFKGKGCEAATADYEEALGSVEKRTKKPEYHAVQTTGNSNSVQG